MRDLDTVLSAVAAPSKKKREKLPFKFRSKTQLIQHLQQYGYEVKEKARIKGKSGARHTIDVLATKDDGIITHHIAIGIAEGKQPVPLERIFEFDDKAYDIGILDKAFIASPGLSPEARQFARRQKIKVFNVRQLENKQ